MGSCPSYIMILILRASWIKANVSENHVPIHALCLKTCKTLFTHVQVSVSNKLFRCINTHESPSRSQWSESKEITKISKGTNSDNSEPYASRISRYNSKVSSSIGSRNSLLRRTSSEGIKSPRLRSRFPVDPSTEPCPPLPTVWQVFPLFPPGRSSGEAPPYIIEPSV